MTVQALCSIVYR